QGKWGGEMMVNGGPGPWKRCKGDPTTCPTRKLTVASNRRNELRGMGDSALTAFKDWLAAGASGEFPEKIASFKTRLDDVPDHYHQYVAKGVPLFADLEAGPGPARARRRWA